MEAWEHIAPELPPGWSVENSGDMDYQQNWATRAADGTVTERGFCGREYAAEDCWEQFGATRKAYAELIAPGLVRETAKAKFVIEKGWWIDYTYFSDGGRHEFRVASNLRPFDYRGSGPDICTAALATIQALGGGE